MNRIDTSSNVSKTLDNLIAQFQAAGICFDKEGAIHKAIEDVRSAAYPPAVVPEPVVLEMTNDEAKLILGLLDDETRFPGGNEESAAAKRLHDAITKETYEEWEYMVAGTKFRRTASNRISANGNGTWNIHFWFGGVTEEHFKSACSNYYVSFW